MSPLRVLGVLAAVLACLALSLSAKAFWAARALPHEWPMTPTERLAASGIDGRAALLSEEIARVSSGDEQLRERIVRIALYLRTLDAESEALAKDARDGEGRPGVALVRSSTGPTWVRRP